MGDSISQRFINAVEPQRHRLYSQALASGGDPSHAEGLLQQALRGAYQQYAAGAKPEQVAELAFGELAAAAARAGYKASMSTPEQVTPMPAAAWARLWAAVQIQAAESGGHKALKADSVLLSADPLLAPKKPRPREDDLEGITPASRFVIAVVLALVVGISLTVYLTTRRHNGNGVPAATQPAASQPEGVRG